MLIAYNIDYVKSDTPNNNFISFFLKLKFNNLTALLHKDLKCKAPLIEPNLRRNLGKWST